MATQTQTTSAETTTSPTSTTVTKETLIHKVKSKWTSSADKTVSVSSTFNVIIAIGTMIVGPWLAAEVLQSQITNTEQRSLAIAIIAFAVLGMITALATLVGWFMTNCDVKEKRKEVLEPAVPAP